MNLGNHTAAIARRAVYGCSDGVQPSGPWSWRFAIQNGTRLPVAAKFEDEFLHLTCSPGVDCRSTGLLERVLLGNSRLSGGAKIVLAEADGTLRVSADIAVVEEKQMQDRLRLAMHGFHDSIRLLKSGELTLEADGEESFASEPELKELLRASSWPSTESGHNDFSVELDADTGAAARIWRTKNSVVASVEFVRPAAISEVCRRATAVFLLTASNTLRFVRAYAAESEGQWSFGMQVGLPSVPAMEEVDHALAALSVARRVCARESNVHLCEAAASCYLAARNLSTTSEPQTEKEN
jgi:hypothetical protein